MQRPFTSADLPALRRLHARQVAGSGVEYAFPDLEHDARYYRVLVVEERGVVRGALVAHATTEVYVIADQPLLLRTLHRERAAIERELCAAGADELHAFVPGALAGTMDRWLQRFGFRRAAPGWTPYYREL